MGHYLVIGIGSFEFIVMELFLLQDVDKVGRKGDVVRVRDGFGRNFLIPRCLALPSTRANQQFVQEHKDRAVKREAAAKLTAEQKAGQLSQLKLTVQAVAGEQDKLFGSVTAEDICEALSKKGYSFDKKQIHLKEPIRSLGPHSVTVEIFPQVKAAVTVDVVRKA